MKKESVGNPKWLLKEFGLAMVIINVSAFMDLNQSWNYIYNLYTGQPNVAAQSHKR